MAVPKRKRYKQIVKSRRSLQNINLILKKNIAVTKFYNYISSLEKFKNYEPKPGIHFCQFCKNKGINNNLCSDCYKDFILGIILPRRRLKLEYHKKTYRIREYYDDLSKTFFSLGGS